MRYSVGQVSRMAHITVRTLHHYDDVGLLRPSMRTEAGYRGYSDADLERLQRILCYRELGFSLDQIKTILDAAGIGALDHLRRQHELLTGRIERLRRMVATVERTMEARKLGVNLDPHEMFEVFGDDAARQGWFEEAEQRFAETPAWAQSRARAATYTKEDWKRITDEGARNQRAFAEAFAAGTPAGATEVMDLAEEHRLHLDRWFFDCGYEMHRRIGDLYVDDPKYAVGYASLAPGLERYVRDAVRANADRHA